MVNLIICFLLQDNSVPLITNLTKIAYISYFPNKLKTISTPKTTVMNPMKIILSLSVSLFLILLLSNCESERTGSGAQITDVTGHAQKGPFINGSSVTIYDLREDLSPTGKSYNAQITDNEGTFQSDRVELSSKYVSLRVDGFYFNEVSGDQSVAQITLYALADVSAGGNINVNLLTHLEKSRVEYLMKNGESFSSAKIQAQKEILAIFNIEEPGMKNSENLDISEAGEDNAILLAVSAILQGYRQESELTELLSDINNDIREDGEINDSSLGSALINHAILLDTGNISNNLEIRYNDIGAPSVIPPFGKYIARFISETGFKVSENLIEYPRTGLYGDNMLYLEDTLYYGDYNTSCSLAAILQKGATLKVKITSMGPGVDPGTIGDTVVPAKPLWYYALGSSLNWYITIFDNNTYTQYFTAIESDASCDLNMFFEKGRFLIEYYEMNARVPTRSKFITVQ
jgi:hypothetical protein